VDQRAPREGMDDAELAEHYYANRDSVVSDEDVDVRIAERPESVVAVRFTPSELSALEQAADAAELKLSAYVRQAALCPSSPVGLGRARRSIREIESLVRGLSEALGRTGWRE
jgi:hypothetical protein